MGKSKLWEDNEDNFLIDHYANKGGQYCAIELNRTVTAVRRRANKIGLSVKYNIGRFNKETMLQCIEESTNIKTALSKMGLRPAGGNYRVFNAKIKEFNIDISHFESKSEIYNRTLQKTVDRRKIPLQDILDGKCPSYSTNTLKNRLIKEGLKENKCEGINNIKCGISEWAGMELKCELDHINGDSTDHRLRNLRILCPNCHAQTETYCGKNKNK